MTTGDSTKVARPRLRLPVDRDGDALVVLVRAEGEVHALRSGTAKANSPPTEVAVDLDGMLPLEGPDSGLALPVVTRPVDRLLQQAPDVGQVFDEVVAELKLGWEAPSQSAYSVVALFIMASWVPCLGSVSPYLAVVGPAGSGKTQLGEILAQLCLQGRMVTSASTAAVVRLLRETGCTLVLDRLPGRLPSNSVLLRLLCAGDRRRGTLLLPAGADSPTECNCFGYKVLLSSHGPENADVAARAITVTTAPGTRLREPRDAAVAEGRAADLRSDLLATAVHYFARFSDGYSSPNLLPGLLNRERDVVAPLAAIASVIDTHPGRQGSVLRQLVDYVGGSRARQRVDSAEDLWSRAIQDFLALPDTKAFDTVGTVSRYLAAKFVEHVNRSKLSNRPRCQREVTQTLVELGLAERFRGSASAAVAVERRGTEALAFDLLASRNSVEMARPTRSQPIVYVFNLTRVNEITGGPP